MYRVWNKWTDNQGYTLLEVLVVLTIMAVLFAALPAIGSKALESNRFKEAGNDIYADIRAVKHSARTSGRQSSVDGDQLRAALNRRGQNGDGYSVDLESDIQFFPNGAATQGRVVLRKDDRVTVIIVNGVTGTILRLDQ